MTERLRSNAGLALALLSAASFGTSGSFASSLIVTGWTPGAAVFARVLVAMAVLMPVAVVQMRAQRVRPTALLGIVKYGVVAVAGAQLCYFNAVQHLSVAVALLLEYSGILLVIGWMWLRRGHRPRPLTLAGAAVALAGLVLVLDILGARHVDLTGVLWALGAAVGLAVYFVVSSGTEEPLPPLVMAWGGLAVATVVLGVAILAGALPAHATTAHVTLAHASVPWLLPVLGMAVIAAAVAFAAGIAAARLLGAKLASFVGLTEVLFGVLFAWLLLGQRLDALQGVGGVLVIAGIALARLDELREPSVVTPPATPRETVAVGAAAP